MGVEMVAEGAHTTDARADIIQPITRRNRPKAEIRASKTTDQERPSQKRKKRKTPKAIKAEGF